MRYQRSALLASACAYALAMAAVTNAQETSPQSSTALEEVVVTGSFIKGTAEDSAIPVEVVSYEELLDLGRPSNLELIKNMSESGGVAGENNRVNFYPIGAMTVNLRSVGSRFTTVVFNGRRFPEQFSVNTGRFNNIAWIPNAAIGSVETLKAGGGSIYGADAVAGVVNYVTRKGFEGLELNADYKAIEDSDGDYNADVVWGKKFDNGDLMVTLSYQHRSQLATIDRNWSRLSYLENPNSYQFATYPTSNPGSLMVMQPSGVPYSPALTPTSNIQMGSSGIFRDLGCEELGGFRGWSPTSAPACYTNTAEMEDLVSEQDNYNVYLEHNYTINDSVKLHTEALLFRQDIPSISLGSTFVSNPASWPLATQTSGAVMTNVGGTSAYFVPGYNPGVAYLMNNLRDSDGSTAFTPAQTTTVTNPAAPGRVALINTLWKPFGNGGSPLTGKYDTQEGHLKMFRITEAISGDLPEFWGTQLEWELGLTYSKINDVKEAQDMLVDRFQAALNGFGGPNCVGGTPGANGCQFFNPFSSAIAQNVFTGASNPYYSATLANDPNLLSWMYVPVSFERIYENYVVDPIVRGELGIDLPGGPIALAVGGQFRMQTEEVLMDAYSNRAYNPCPTLGVINCATSAQVGSLVYNRAGNIFGAAASNYRPEFRKYPVWAAFMEAKLPILSTLDLSLSGRYEKFISDVTDKDNDVFVPAAGIKWQPIEWLGVRTSWGKTFSQVNPPRDRAPIVTTALASSKYTGLGGGTAPFANYNYANVDVEPEKGDYLDVGLLFDVGNFRGSVDYYNMAIDDYTRTMSVANVLDGLAMPGSVAGPANATLVNCSSAVLSQAQSSMDNRPLVELPVPCVQGTTMMSDLINGRVNYFAGNGQTNSGELKTSGIDLSASYRFDNVFGGSLTPSLDYSRILEWKLADFSIGGVKLADGYDGLGFVNLSSGRTGVSVAEWRGTFGVAYRREGHTINLQLQYVPSIVNEDATNYTASVGRNANIGDANGIVPTGAACPTGNLTSDLGNVPAGAGTGQYGTTVGGIRGLCSGQNTAPQSGHEVEEWMNLDLIYRVELPAETGVTLTINNVLDRDPSYFRGIVPYNTAYGSPLGRTVKLGVSKRF